MCTELPHILSSSLLLTSNICSLHQTYSSFPATDRSFILFSKRYRKGKFNTMGSESRNPDPIVTQYSQLRYNTIFGEPNLKTDYGHYFTDLSIHDLVNPRKTLDRPVDPLTFFDTHTRLCNYHSRPQLSEAQAESLGRLREFERGRHWWGDFPMKVR